MGKIILILSLFLSIFVNAMQIQCQDVFAKQIKKSEPKSSLSFVDEEQRFLLNYNQFIKGKNFTPETLITPLNRIVLLLDPKKNIQYQGRILSALMNERGRPEILFLEKKEDGTYADKPIRIPYGSLGFIQLRVQYSDQELDERRQALIQAANLQSFLTFKHRFLGRFLTGQVLSVQEDYDGKVQSFVFEYPSLGKRSFDLQAIEKIKSLQPGMDAEVLTETKDRLLEKTKSAMEHHRYVEVVLEEKNTGVVQEGWVVRLSTNFDGKYFIHLDPQQPHESIRTYAIPFDRVSKVNFREKYDIRYPGISQQTNLFDPSITMKTWNVTDPEVLSKIWTELKFYSRDINSSGPRMPKTLRNEMQIGQEMRFYFSSEKGTLRLIVRRTSDDSWDVGMSELLPKMDEESMEKSEQNIVYTQFEQITLEVKKTLPAYYLRQYLRQIKKRLFVPKLKTTRQKLEKDSGPLSGQP